METIRKVQSGVNCPEEQDRLSAGSEEQWTTCNRLQGQRPNEQSRRPCSIISHGTSTFALSRIKHPVLECCVRSCGYACGYASGTVSQATRSVLSFLLLFSLWLSVAHCYDPYVAYKGGLARNYGGGPSGGGGYGTFGDAYQQQHHQAQQYNQYGLSLVGNDYSAAAPQYPHSYAPYRKYYKQYLPGPQYCPETGRTVCSKVAPFYPIDEVFSVVKMARAKRFNISSEFVDESENDAEPHFEVDEPWPEPEPFLPPTPHIGFGPVVHHGDRGQGVHGGHGGFGKPLAHFHNFDFKPYFGGKHDYRATVAPPYHQKAIYSTSYSGAPVSTYGSSYAAAASASAAVVSHARYKRQANAGNGGTNDQIPIEPICPSRIILIEPKAALNDKRQWKFIVNLSERDPRLKQAIKVEVCTTPNQPCSNQINLPFGFVSRCRQKYIKKKLISLDPSGQSISSENFFAPSCCVCEVIRNVAGAGATSTADAAGDNTAAASNLAEVDKKKRKKK